MELQNRKETPNKFTGKKHGTLGQIVQIPGFFVHHPGIP
jgi:hypothetical protein